LRDEAFPEAHVNNGKPKPIVRRTRRAGTVRLARRATVTVLELAAALTAQAEAVTTVED
jgi:hypothetical protein